MEGGRGGDVRRSEREREGLGRVTVRKGTGGVETHARERTARQNLDFLPRCRLLLGSGFSVAPFLLYAINSVQ